MRRSLIRVQNSINDRRKYRRNPLGTESADSFGIERGSDEEPSSELF